MTAVGNTTVSNGDYGTYRLYGLTLTSNFPFANRLVPGVGPPDITFTCTSSAPLSVGWDQTEPAYASLPRDDGISDILLYCLDECWVVRFRTADFYLWSDHILCHTTNRGLAYLVEIQLLGVVMSCWLERQGVPALHASAVVADGSAAAFLSVGGGGKSSIAAALMQNGCPLLTDDILAVERTGGTYLGHPGYPQLRMWPEQARRFLDSYEQLDIVHPSFSKLRVPVEREGLGVFCDEARPLACLYVPERRDADVWGTRIEIEPLSRREGLLALIGQSFVPEIVEAAGLQPRRLGFLASLVLEVQVRRISYPSGYDHLPRVRRTILDDLAGSASSKS